MSLDDRRRVRSAALRVGVWVGCASAAAIAVGTVLLVSVIVATGRRRGDGPGPPRDPDHLFVDVDRVVPVVLVLGAIGVLLLAAIAVVGARRAVRPIEDTLRRQREFVSDASHELRTPLTALNGRIQILQRHYERGQPLDETILRLRSDVAAMSDLVTDLLLDAEGTADPSAIADVAAVAAEAIARLRPLADEAGVTIRMTATGRPWVAMPPVTLTRICVALIDNAIVHSPSGGPVTVTVDTTGGAVHMRVADSGAGIAPADAERVFERFARGTETGRRRGFGLGLALARSAAERHGGTVRIESTSTTGTTFLLTLPRART